MHDHIHGVVHSFTDNLEFSARLSDEPAWVEFYRRIWPEMTVCVATHRNGQGQHQGQDRAIHLRSGRVFFIDEKKRRPAPSGVVYHDVLLEDWSVWHGEGDRRNKVGWALDENKRCDFVAYAIPAASKCYLLPFEFLRVAFRENLIQWERAGRVPDARNHGYVTRNIAVPWPTLREALVQQMHRKFGTNQLPLPVPEFFGEQVHFDWSEL